MKVVELLERRRRNWQELERMCDLLQGAGTAKQLTPPDRSRFGALYRAACADLALAYAYQLPQNTVALSAPPRRPGPQPALSQPAI